MTEVDLNRLPTGEMGWAALVAHAVASDDRIERYFLEVKSDVDLNTKAGRAKVAKFILGAANRDLAQASRRFGGHAVMLLGVGGGAAPGIAPFEAQDLARDITKWIGVEGPTWDFERIQTDGPRDVIAVVVDPPTGAVWTCRADGDGLADGDIYVRSDGNTRKASGDEVRAMLARAVSVAPIVDIDVEPVGQAIAITVDELLLTNWINWRKANFLQQIAPRPPARPYGLMSLAALDFARDVRSQDEFRAEVEEWYQKAILFPTRGIIATAGQLFPGLGIRVRNQTKTFMRDVRIDIEFDASVRATEWRERRDQIDLFPEAPADWGTRQIGALGAIGHYSKMVVPRDHHGVVEITSSDPARLVMMMNTLRPEEDFQSEETDAVLVMLADGDPGEVISGSWRLTAADVNAVHTGMFTVPVAHLDWRNSVSALLRDEGCEGADNPEGFTCPGRT